MSDAMASVRFSSVMGNRQKLDGGAMFGNAPKALWSRWTEPDQANRIDLACRGLLIETSTQKILLETGIGAYMEPKLRDRFGVVESEHVLLQSLEALSLGPEDIDVIVLSHLHFDHAGGLLSAWRDGEAPQLVFPNAQFLVGRGAYERASHPHPRDRASFIPDLVSLLRESGRLRLLDAHEILQYDGLEIGFYESHGHTPAMLCADLRWNEQRMVFAADLIPARPWVHVPITMGYDRFPERLIDEKTTLLADLAASAGFLYFTHDPEFAMGQVAYDATRNRYSVVEERAELVRADL